MREGMMGPRAEMRSRMRSDNADGPRRDAVRRDMERDPARRGMDRAQLDRFIQHYERTSRHLLATLLGTADRVIRQAPCPVMVVPADGR